MVVIGVFGLGYVFGSGYPLDNDSLFGNVLSADDLSKNVAALEGDDFFVNMKEYPEDFPVFPYFDKLALKSVSKMTEDSAATYLVYLSSDFGTPLTHVEALKEAYGAAFWDVQTPDPLDNVYTFRAEKDNYVLNVTLKAPVGAGADIIVSAKVL